MSSTEHFFPLQDKGEEESETAIISHKILFVKNMCWMRRDMKHSKASSKVRDKG